MARTAYVARRADSTVNMVRYKRQMEILVIASDMKYVNTDAQNPYYGQPYKLSQCEFQKKHLDDIKVGQGHPLPTKERKCL